LVQKHSKDLSTDRYYKKFKTYDHMVAMLYAIFHQCTSIRELTTGMLACQNKLGHIGLKSSPRKSTLSEANAKRDSSVFERIYISLYDLYHGLLPDSRSKNPIKSRLYIIDSTTITLFKEILKNAGRNPISGKRKGGIKAHTLTKADEDIPRLVRITSAATHDVTFLKHINLPSGSILVFDKGYVDYSQYQRLSENKVTWVTRATIYKVGQN
jgi:hypothetical protein